MLGEDRFGGHGRFDLAWGLGTLTPHIRTVPPWRSNVSVLLWLWLLWRLLLLLLLMWLLLLLLGWFVTLGRRSPFDGAGAVLVCHGHLSVLEIFSVLVSALGPALDCVGLCQMELSAIGMLLLLFGASHAPLEGGGGIHARQFLLGKGVDGQLLTVAFAFPRPLLDG